MKIKLSFVRLWFDDCSIDWVLSTYGFSMGSRGFPFPQREINDCEEVESEMVDCGKRGSIQNLRIGFPKARSDGVCNRFHLLRRGSGISIISHTWYQIGGIRGSFIQSGILLDFWYYHHNYLGLFGLVMDDCQDLIHFSLQISNLVIDVTGYFGFQKVVVYIVSYVKSISLSFHISQNFYHSLTYGFFSWLVFDSKMTQGQWIAKSGEKKGDGLKAGIRILIPRFDNTEIIARYERTLIGRCMNPQKQDMKILLFLFPRIWKVEGRAVGTDLGLGRFQFDFEQEEDIIEVPKMEPFHFDFWMVSLVRWKPVLEPNYPTKITFWVRVLDIPLQFRVAQIFQSVGEAIGKVQGPVDLAEGRVRVELDGFNPMVFSMDIKFEEGVEIKVALRYEKLFGYCRECFKLTHESSRCPSLHQEEPARRQAEGSGPEGAQVASFKAMVTNGGDQVGASRVGQQLRPQNARGDKGKGIAREKQGVFKREGSYHPYKERMTMMHGGGSSFHSKDSGYGNRRSGMHSRDVQPRGVQNRGGQARDQQSSGLGGEQQVPDPTKLMLDAFKGAYQSPSVVGTRPTVTEGCGGSSKARKALLFEEPTREIDGLAIATVVNETEDLQRCRYKRQIIQSPLRKIQRLYTLRL